MTFTQFTQNAQSRLDTLFKNYLIDSPAPRLQEAIIYAALNGGKRIRPLLVYLTGHALDATWDHLDPAACAIELIHIYSLIHDDLPAMDNADLRRGKPACHKAFDEATAILAGDALQPLAFEIIVKHPAPLSLQQRIHMIKIISEVSGMQGMAAGQMLDIQGAHSLEELTEMYRLKTGVLLAASVQLGAIAAGINDHAILNALQLFAEKIGLAFQIQDDLLDTKNTTGKTQGIDQINQKITYPSLIGVEKSEQKLKELFLEAISALDILQNKNALLKEFTQHLMTRQK